MRLAASRSLTSPMPERLASAGAPSRRAGEMSLDVRHDNGRARQAAEQAERMSYTDGRGVDFRFDIVNRQRRVGQDGAGGPAIGTHENGRADRRRQIGARLDLLGEDRTPIRDRRTPAAKRRVGLHEFPSEPSLLKYAAMVHGLGIRRQTMNRSMFRPAATAIAAVCIAKVGTIAQADPAGKWRVDT